MRRPGKTPEYKGKPYKPMYGTVLYSSYGIM